MAFPSTIFTKNTASPSQTLDAFNHTQNHNDIQDEVVAIETKIGVDGSAVKETLDYKVATGWVAAGETWTYGSADDPTFTLTTPGDKTTKYYPGMRVKLTQTTDKYFIITKVAYTTETTITLYGGTDYDLANATIVNPAYSMVKCPAGFPLDPTKWDFVLSDTSDRTQASPVGGTFYNLGSLSLNIPIGAWRVEVELNLRVEKSGTSGTVFAGLSTANNSISDVNLKTAHYNTVNSDQNMRSRFGSPLILTAKTTYYLVAMFNQNGTSLSFMGSQSAPTKVRCICAYL